MTLSHDLLDQVRAALGARRPWEIVQAGDPVLRTPAQRYDGQLPDELLRELVESMRAHLAGRGVGLAAPQVGIPLAIAVIEDPADVSVDEASAKGRYPQRFLALLNPSLRLVGEQTHSFFEGCLSVDGWAAVVRRHRQVELAFTDLDGQQCSVELVGWPARIAQHEVDHLRGVLYLDRALPRSLSSKANLEAYWNEPYPHVAGRVLGFDVSDGSDGAGLT